MLAVQVIDKSGPGKIHEVILVWTKNEVISCGFDLPITDSCCSDSEGYTLYMSLGPLSICTSLQLRKLTHTKAET